MSTSSEQVKLLIKKFVEANLDQNIFLETKHGEHQIANKSIFEIEAYLIQLRKEYSVNDRIDTSISSAHILNNFASKSAGLAFRPVDYQYNFLYHLAKNHEPDKELFQLIDSFVLSFKDQLSISDIVITNTGATRCKTNIRFALNGLRDMGLVLNKDAKNKRSWAPSVIGLVGLINISLQISDFATAEYYKDPATLTCGGPGRRIPSYYGEDPMLRESLDQFADPNCIYSFLTNFSSKLLGGRDKKNLEKILDQYIDFTQAGLEITPNGIKQTPLFKQRSMDFQQKLFALDNVNPDLYLKLQGYFRNKS